MFTNILNELIFLQEGDRIGVKKTSLGNLHLYINGVDKGAVASEIPPCVFGVLILTNDVVAATIVDHS